MLVKVFHRIEDASTFPAEDQLRHYSILSNASFDPV
jgi:hypothetical protein